MSDRGPQFTPQLLNVTCRQWGAIQKLTTAYHLQTNLTERANRTRKVMISSYVKDNHQNWDQWIHEFRLAINSSWQESTKYTPAEIALGRKLKGPLELFQYRSPDSDQSAYEVIEHQQSLLERLGNRLGNRSSKLLPYFRV